MHPVHAGLLPQEITWAAKTCHRSDKSHLKKGVRVAVARHQSGPVKCRAVHLTGFLYGHGLLLAARRLFRLAPCAWQRAASTSASPCSIPGQSPAAEARTARSALVLRLMGGRSMANPSTVPQGPAPIGWGPDD